jgi:nucleotide-binding universal stress UspA family protein
MYKHILIPTDGSALSVKAVKAGVRLAKALGAKVTGVHVVAPYYTPPIPLEGGVYVPGMSAEAYRAYSYKQARKALAPVEREARAARVRCKTKIMTAPRPAEAILKTARSNGCDAIAMASRCRGGFKTLMLGSATRRVLEQSRIPVVVLR